MDLNRRQLLGVAAIGSLALAAPQRVFAAVKAANTPALLPRAMAALDLHAKSVSQRDVVGIVDFAAHSCLPRFHLVDVASGQTSTFLVAHGRGSDPTNLGWVQKFSNQPGSNASCEGSFVTGDIYMGKHGRSRRIDGLEAANNAAAERAIVIHAAPYVGTAIARSQGRIGRSEGCFAVSSADLESVLARLGPGRLIFASK